MRQGIRSALVCALLGGAMLVGSAEEAEAKKRLPLLFFINTGDEIKRVADLPEELAAIPELEGWALGWKYEHFGIMWADFSTSNHSLVIFKDNTYDDIPDEIRGPLEEMYPFSDCERNLWNRFGWMVLVGLVGTGVYKKLKGGGD